MLVCVVWHQQTHVSFLGLERSTNLPKSHSYSAIVFDWKLRAGSKLFLPLCSLVCWLHVDSPGSLPCWTKTIKLLNNMSLLAKSLESLYFCLSVPLSSWSLCLSLPSSSPSLLFSPFFPCPILSSSLPDKYITHWPLLYGHPHPCLIVDQQSWFLSTFFSAYKSYLGVIDHGSYSTELLSKFINLYKVINTITETDE